MLPHALPHQPGTADLGEGGEHEQQHRPDDRHGRIIARDRPRVRGRAAGPGRIGRCERTPGRPGARAPLRRRTRAALARALHRAPHVAARLGPRRPRPLPLHLQRERHHRGLRLGPRDRPPPPRHRPAQRHLRRHPPARRRAVWWFADTDGDEHGHWVTEPFAGGDHEPALPGVEDGYSAGLDVGRSVVAAGTSTDAGTRIWVRRGDGAAQVIYAQRRGRGRRRASPRTRPCSRSATPSTATPATRTCGWCGWPTGARSPRSPTAPARASPRSRFAPVPGDPRLLLLHERRGREELLIWDVDADTETEIRARPARRGGRRLRPDAAFLLVWHTHAARTRLYRYDLDRRRSPSCRSAPGCVGSAAGPAGRHRRVLVLVGRGADDRARAAPGRHRPRAGRAARRARAGLGARRGPVGGRSGRTVHALVARPRARPAAAHGVQPARRPARRRRGPLQRRPARPGWTPGSPSSRSTTAARRATARPGATRSRAAPG